MSALLELAGGTSQALPWGVRLMMVGMLFPVQCLFSVKPRHSQHEPPDYLLHAFFALLPIFLLFQTPRLPSLYNEMNIRLNNSPSLDKLLSPSSPRFNMTQFDSTQ